MTWRLQTHALVFSIRHGQTRLQQLQLAMATFLSWRLRATRTRTREGGTHPLQCQLVRRAAMLQTAGSQAQNEWAGRYSVQRRRVNRR